LVSSYKAQCFIHRTAPNAPRPTPGLISPTELHFNFSGKNSATLSKDYLHTNTHHCL